MRRREFVGLLAAIAISPQAVLAQTTKKRPLVGWLYYSRNDLADRYLRLVLDGMRELGDMEGRDFEMVYTSADGHVERLAKAAEELVQLNPDIIITSATIQAVAAKKATNTIPIVVPVLADPIGLGFVASEARPGGNVTGIAPYVKGLPSKQLELAREVVTGATRIGLVDDVNDPKAHPQRREIEAAGKELDIKIVPAEVRTAGDIKSALRSLGSGRRRGGHRGAELHANHFAQTDSGGGSGEEVTHGLWLPRARRSGWSHQLRRQSGFVLPSRGLLRRQNLEGHQTG